MSDETSTTQAGGDGRKVRVGLGEVLALVAAVVLVVSPFLATYSGHLIGRTYSYTGWHSLFIAQLVAVQLFGALVGLVAILAGLGVLPRALPWTQWATGAAVAVVVGAVVSPIGYNQFLIQAHVPRTIGIGLGPKVAIAGAVVLLIGCALASVPAANVALVGRSGKAAQTAGGGYDQAAAYAQGGYGASGYGASGYYGQQGPGQQAVSPQSPNPQAPGQQPAGGYGAGPSNPWSAPSQPASQSPSPWAPQPAEARAASNDRADQPAEPTTAWQAPGPVQSLGGQPDQSGEPQPGESSPSQPNQPQTGQPASQAGQPAWGEPSPWALGGGPAAEAQPGGADGGSGQAAAGQAAAGQAAAGQQTAAQPAGAGGSFSPFWGAVPTPRTVFHPDNRQSPVGVVQPGAWYAVVAQQPDGSLLVQLPDGSHGVLVETNDLIRA